VSMRQKLKIPLKFSKCFVLCYVSAHLISYCPFYFRLIVWYVSLSILCILWSALLLLMYIAVLFLLCANVGTTATGWKPSCSK
jgi:hypothetical protein